MTVYKMVFEENTFMQSWRIERNMLSSKISCEKDILFLSKCCDFGCYVLLLSFLVLKYLLHLKYKEPFRFRKS